MPKPKSKGTKDDDSKKNRKKPTTVEEVEHETRDDQTNVISSNEIGINSTSDMVKQEPVIVQEEIEEVKYDEPVLTSIVVERYEGEKEKGLFQGYGTAYYKGGNIYEGEFHSGMMSGKGKYTWANENVTYEGDFLNNEITGHGLFKWINNDPAKTTTYEGEVLKGKRNGVGIFKSGISPIVYNGEWNMGKRNGKGKMIYDVDGNTYYEGDWVNNKKYGWGIYRYPSGNVYEGMWVKDIRHGEGTMRWFDKNQIYTGQWENGIQNGLGEHSWYLARIDMTQYCLRNTYYGNFKNGKRHGQGTFLYADGSKYEGNWEENLKCGWGKYTGKDGLVYEGYFEEDKMTNSPTYKRTSKLSTELTKIKTRVPSAGTTLNINGLRSHKDLEKIEYNLKLDLSSILADIDDDEEKNLEIMQAHKTIIRYLDLFKQVYRFYSQLGFDSSPDNTYVLNRMQFWRFLKDCKVNLNDDYLTLMDFDRFLDPNMNGNDLHCPYDKIILREFFNYIVLTSYHLYKEKFEGKGPIISWCIEKLIVDNILPHACNVQGYFYSDARKTLSILSYMVKAYEIYRFLCKKRQNEKKDWSITMRKFLHILNDLKLLDSKILTSKEVIEIMASDNPIVYDANNSYNLELEITFLEFFEILIGCAVKSYDRLKQIESSNSKNLLQSGDGSMTQSIQITEKPDDKSNDAKQLSQADMASGQNKDSTVNVDELKMTPDQALPNNLPLTNLDEQTLEIVNNEMPLTATAVDLDKKELELWNEQNSLFFSNHFFPAAERHIAVIKAMNGSL